MLFAWRSGHLGGAAHATGVRRMAVLPFENLGDSADGYFADALAERNTEAIRAGQRVLALLPPHKDAYLGPYIQHQLARIYLIVGALCHINRG